MNKTLAIILVIAATIVTIAMTLDYSNRRTIDWEESFNEKSNKPYGVSIFYKELPKLLEGQKLKTIYYTPYNYFYANSEDGYGDHVAEGNYVLVGNSDYLELGDIEELLLFAGRGNTLFMSDYTFPQTLLDTLDIAIDVVQNKDSISQLSFTNPNLKSKNSTIDKNESSSYFSEFEPENYTVLGYVNGNPKLTNFLEIPFGEGTIYLHLEPKVFTNYNILKEQRYRYTEGALSYLPNATIYFDSYTKYFNSQYGDAEEKSDLSWFLQQPAFKWAWYLTLILTLLFMVFNAKRRQRIIPIVKPLENTTVGFVKTISNLYYETQDHKNLIDKKITYFLEKIRSDYNLDTTTLNEEFITKLAQKSGKRKETVKKTINFINWLRTKNEFFEENLLKLNKHIEEFYS
ncbi:hypothetical protein LX77_00527 [Gelidibacter algens]|uniref:DUF4350 domain-containing protein n=1 Tax=Gelidibacter algens TaxID=49280 RepID=A0A1A7R8P0_9FLAO|nr:DUF4350 domain-containing protein [Gelidibacter algens]OBX27087.1 hypothetical protein A9996_01550 [Gelidibacter algens]RAJ27953.1 hypothetical protein LX77_00527 [Gelidibacter algens]